MGNQPKMGLICDSRHYTASSGMVQFCVVLLHFHGCNTDWTSVTQYRKRYTSQKSSVVWHEPIQCVNDFSRLLTGIVDLAVEVQSSIITSKNFSTCFEAIGCFPMVISANMFCDRPSAACSLHAFFSTYRLIRSSTFQSLIPLPR